MRAISFILPDGDFSFVNKSQTEKKTSKTSVTPRKRGNPQGNVIHNNKHGNTKQGTIYIILSKRISFHLLLSLDGRRLVFAARALQQKH